MPIRTERFITRVMLRAEPDTLWVFGDNLQRRGLGGQAKEMRGEPNAIGIPTKRAPGMGPSDFFGSDDLPAYLNARAGDLFRLVRHIRDGGTVVLPADGLGTGRARLKQTSPAIWAQLQADVFALREMAALTTHQAEVAKTPLIPRHPPPAAGGSRDFRNPPHHPPPPLHPCRDLSVSGSGYGTGCGGAGVRGI